MNYLRFWFANFVVRVATLKRLIDGQIRRLYRYTLNISWVEDGLITPTTADTFLTNERFGVGKSPVLQLEFVEDTNKVEMSIARIALKSWILARSKIVSIKFNVLDLVL